MGPLGEAPGRGLAAFLCTADLAELCTAGHDRPAGDRPQTSATSR
jgi:hypothetical protein